MNCAASARNSSGVISMTGISRSRALAIVATCSARVSASGPVIAITSPRWWSVSRDSAAASATSYSWIGACAEARKGARIGAADRICQAQESRLLAKVPGAQDRPRVGALGDGPFDRAVVQLAGRSAVARELLGGRQRGQDGEAV